MHSVHLHDWDILIPFPYLSVRQPLNFITLPLSDMFHGQHAEAHPSWYITTREAKDVSETHPKKSGLLKNLFFFAVATVHRHTAHRTRGTSMLQCVCVYLVLYIVWFQSEEVRHVCANHYCVLQVACHCTVNSKWALSIVLPRYCSKVNVSIQQKKLIG